MKKAGGALTIQCPHIYALIPKTAALFILLWQVRLLAADLADTPVFGAALLAALGTALFLFLKNVKPLPSVCIIALVPWTARFFISFPRWFAADFGALTTLDALLLNLDRNNFAALLPFYWTAGAAYFSLRSRTFLRADIIAADVFFLVLFSIAPSAAMEAYRWPVLMIGLFGAVFFLQILAFILSTPPELKLTKPEGAAAAFIFLFLIILGGVFFIRPSQEKAVERGGGLLEPKLFKFDFSQVLRLDTEISVNDDLVLIAKINSEDYLHTLLRRYTLSGYDKKQGFYRLEDVDETAHPQRLPDRPTELPDRESIRNYRITNQEYYLVNFDSSAFIGMNMPVETTPFETWDASSFSSAYGVQSYTSEAWPFGFELMAAVRGAPSAESLGLSAADYRLYTEYGGDEDIAALAGAITEGITNYNELVEAVYDYLKFGEYRYSLKPGIAPDGDQLKFFLFETKKGYCTYYAFAFALLLRSLGIPARTAAGFFIDPDTNTFNYYPVRADMAHAWVEVWYPQYGWIEYDPTSQELAEGEEFRFSQGTPPELFERLMKEILDNHSRLRPKQGEGEEDRRSFEAIGRETIRFVRHWGPFVLAVLLMVCFIYMRAGRFVLSRLTGKPRRRAVYLWAHVKRRLALGGIKKPPALSEAEWAVSGDGRFGGLYALYQDYAAARFARDYTGEDPRRVEENYRRFDGAVKREISTARRLLGWLLPPLALVLVEKARGKGRPGRRGGLLLLAVLLLSQAAGGPGAQNAELPADELYNFARDAQLAENWERAVEFYSRGSAAYPGDLRFPWALGNLYYNRRLFRLAWDEYRRVDKLDPWNPEMLFQLSRTAAYLNEDTLSAGYLEQLLMLDPDNREAIGNLGWMYYKIHRLSDGEELLVSAIQRLGAESDFAMTLGTIYSDMFNYAEGKRWYLRSIEDAESAGDSLFAAVAYYNLSILESRFYQFDLAYTGAGKSLEQFDRASGRLALGELYLRRLALPRALAEYQEAYEMDTSPLSKLNLAQVYQIGGRLEEARLYAEDCLKAADLSWMLNYGIDPVRYRRDIHEILKDTYEGLEKAESYTAPASVSEKIRGLFRKAAFRFKAEVHSLLFRKYCLLSAEAYNSGNGLDRNQPAGAGGTHLDALTQYYNAFEGYPRRAAAYLRLAGVYETALIPESLATYAFEEGKLLGKKELIVQAADQFDPLWERDMIAEAYAELAVGRGTRAERRDAAERLFALNRGVLRQKGIRLPMNLVISGGAGLQPALKKAVKTAGMDISGGESRYTLTISAGNGGESPGGVISCELYDGGRGTVVYRGNITLASLSGKDRALFARALSNGVFNGF
jgi:transglutaminase-like putative cysteine protease